MCKYICIFWFWFLFNSIIFLYTLIWVYFSLFLCRINKLFPNFWIFYMVLLISNYIYNVKIVFLIIIPIISLELFVPNQSLTSQSSQFSWITFKRILFFLPKSNWHYYRICSRFKLGERKGMWTVQISSTRQVGF